MFYKSGPHSDTRLGLALGHGLTILLGSALIVQKLLGGRGLSAAGTGSRTEGMWYRVEIPSIQCGRGL